MNKPLELSCYTSSLVAYMEPGRPAVREELARALELSVRTDLPDGTLAFSHHPRIDTDTEGRGLVYRGSPDWAAVRAALRAETAARGRVLVVGNTRHMPWSPARDRSESPHWFLVEAQDGGDWLVEDRFAALTPHGEQSPYHGPLGDDTLRRVLTPAAAPPPEIRNRDRYALGTAVGLPPDDHYRWLEWSVGPLPREAGPEGRWVRGPIPSLEYLAGFLCRDESAPARHADDVWTIVRHERFRLSVEAAAGRVPPEVDELTAAWDELPRAVRFAAASAERGRPRPALLEKTFARAVSALGAVEEGSSVHVA